MKIQGREITLENLEKEGYQDSPIGEVIEDGKRIVMTIQDAKKFGLSYFTHWYGPCEKVAHCPK